MRETAAARAVQLRDQAALRAQAEAVRGVLDVAARDGAAVVDEGGDADRVAGVRGVRPGHGVPGHRTKPGPVDGGHLPCPFRYGMPSAFGIRSRWAESARTISVMTYGVAATTWLGTSLVVAYQV